VKFEALARRRGHLSERGAIAAHRLKLGGPANIVGFEAPQLLRGCRRREINLVSRLGQIVDRYGSQVEAQFGVSALE